MSDDGPDTVEFKMPPLTAHLVRRLGDPLGEIDCEISGDSGDFGRGEEGGFIVASVPLIVPAGTKTGNEEIHYETARRFFTALHLLHPDNDESGPWCALEEVIKMAFDRGREFERSQAGRKPGERDDERDDSSYVPS